MTIELSELKPFAKGGNRLCFIHPTSPGRCIKVRRPDFTLADLRRKKGFPKTLKPLSSFDDNAEEYRVMMSFDRQYGRSVYQHISECFGFEETDLGKGLVSELICDHDGRVSFSLKQYLWECGRDDSFDAALEIFCGFLVKHVIPSRELLLHNIIAQRGDDGQVIRLVLIDGLGNGNIIPFNWLPSSVRKSKVTRKIQRLRANIDDYITSCELGKVPSHVGRLLHNGMSDPETTLVSDSKLQSKD